MKASGGGMSRFVEHVLTRYRGLFATLVLLPVSALYNIYVLLRDRIVLSLKIAPVRHDQKVRWVIEQIEAWKRDGCREKLCTARSGWKSMSELSYKHSHRKIDVGLYDILETDEERRLLKVEPLATMGQISRHLVPRGWTLPVVPERDDLTVGGLIMGFGVETSSHKYGLIQHICESFDVVTAEGKLLRCSASENPELFLPDSLESRNIGFSGRRPDKNHPRQKIRPAYYRPVYPLDEMVDVFEAESRDTEKNDFVEGLVYSRDTAVVLCGTMSDAVEADGPLNPIGRWYKPLFYRHARTYLMERKGANTYRSGIISTAIREATSGRWRTSSLSAIIPCSDGYWDGRCHRASSS